MFAKGTPSLITCPLMCLSFYLGNLAEFITFFLKTFVLSLQYIFCESGQLCGSFPVPADPEIVSFVFENLALDWENQGHAYDKNLYHLQSFEYTGFFRSKCCKTYHFSHPSPCLDGPNIVI